MKLFYQTCFMKYVVHCESANCSVGSHHLANKVQCKEILVNQCMGLPMMYWISIQNVKDQCKQLLLIHHDHKRYSKATLCVLDSLLSNVPSHNHQSSMQSTNGRLNDQTGIYLHTLMFIFLVVILIVDRKIYHHCRINLIPYAFILTTAYCRPFSSHFQLEKSHKRLVG